MTICEIRDKLTNDEIDYSAAYEEIKKFPKAWHTKDWEDTRQKVIKNYCEQCKSTEGVMVAQHLSHPPEFKTIRNEMFNSYSMKFWHLLLYQNQLLQRMTLKSFTIKLLQ